MSDREHAHELIDRLPDAQVSALVGLLETIIDPVAAALRNAPAVTEARDWVGRRGGKGIPHEEAMRRLGLARE